jgi:Protein of unknown function (DUF2958)
MQDEDNGTAEFRPTEAPALYAQDGAGYDAIVHAHYFIGGNDWLVTEYDPEEGTAFGWACLGGDRQNAELGYVSMAELEDIKAPLRVVRGTDVIQIGHAIVERDAYWTPVPLREAIELLDQRQGR